MIYKKQEEGSFIDECAVRLLREEILVLPTDTIYGFSGIVNARVEKKIRDLKGREENKPFIVLIANKSDVKLFSDEEISPVISNKWPAPLTVILHLRSELIAKWKRETIALRCPNDAWLRKVIEKSAPIFSTSCNKAHLPPCKSAREIEAVFGEQVNFIVQGEEFQSLPSTVVTADGKVIRQGEVKL